MIDAHAYPGVWVEELYDEEGDTVYGETFFPADGSAPEISISAELTVRDAVEGLVHELAHVAAGAGAEQGRNAPALFLKNSN